MIFSRHILSARKNILLILSELEDLYRFSYTIEDIEDQYFSIYIRITFDNSFTKYLKCSLYDELKYNLGKYQESSSIEYNKGIVIKCYMCL